MPGRARRTRPVFDIWPGFVDALASLLILIIFVLLIFMVAQFYLTDAVTGRDKALQALNRRIAEISELLALERNKSARLDKTLKQIAAELSATLAARNKALAEAKGLRGSLGAGRRAAERAVERERKLTAAARAQIDVLNLQIAELRRQLGAIVAALQISEAKVKRQDLKIADLGKRLNLALVRKVRELNRYRSEFFGRLREVLGHRKDIRIVGDRFVFQSEVLFPTGEARLQPAGEEQIRKLAETLKVLAAKIPPEIDWVLRVDGHTDKRPIRRANFPSNWELSQARALAVVRHLILQGVPPKRLAPTGFGEFHPLDKGDNEEAYRKNRRIELKFTQR